MEESTTVRGWLLKRSTVSSKWKKRFFILQKDQLVYYRSLRDSKPARVVILNEYSKVVDYGLEEDSHQFSLFDHDKRVYWLAADDNKAKYWIFVIRTAINQLKGLEMSDPEVEEPVRSSTISSNEIDEKEYSYLRDNIESSTIPSSMQELSYLLHETSLQTTLESCTNGCLNYSVNWKNITQTPYHMLSLSIPLHIECVTYFIIDYFVSRTRWDPLFVRAEEIQQIDLNNRVLHLFYKPIEVMNFPCMIRSRMRDFCVHLHYNYDSNSNLYYVMLSSVPHAICPPLTGFVRGEMQIGYRIEAVNSKSTRIDAIWSISPEGNLSSFSYYSNLYAEKMMSALPGLRDLLSQLPSYHVFSLLEQVTKKFFVSEIHASKSQKSLQDSVSQSPSSDDDFPDSVQEGYPFISNTVPHVSRCSSLRHCWSEVDASVWKVRNVGYAESREKITSESCFCSLLCVDLFSSSKPISHIAERSECALHQLKDVDLSHAECVLIINLRLSGNISVVSYCVIPKETNDNAGKLLHRFLNETDEWRNQRFKLLPHIVEGGYIVKKMVGMTPCLIGTKGDSTYFKGDSPVPYFECDFNMDSSTVARNMSRFLFSGDDMVVELGFVIQGDTDDELPERVFSGFRFYHLSLEASKAIE